jgi:hypothetical protein
VLHGGQHGEHGAAIAAGIQAPSSADDALAILPQDLEAAVSAGIEQAHLPNLCGLAGASLLSGMATPAAGLRGALVALNVIAVMAA